MPRVNQVFPIKKQVPLKGLYLDQRLGEMAADIGRSLVLTNFLTDKNGVVAKADQDGKFQIPAGLKNASDWGRFQELMAQADITISSGAYFKRLETSQDVLYPFEPGGAFETLGQWRLNAGYQKRSPDVAIVTRQLDFDLPDKLLRSGRRIVIFTTDSMARSDKARALSNRDTLIVASGEAGVDGGRMIAALANEMSYRVIMMVSGPHILDLLLAANPARLHVESKETSGANCLDLLYVTQAQVEIPFEDPATVQTILLEGKNLSDLKGFRLAHQFIQDNVETEAGSVISQSFLRYDRKDLHG